MAQAIPAIIAVVAAATSAVVAIKQGQAAESAANYNKAVANQNAEIARKQGIEAQMQQERQNRMRFGSMQANLAATGIDATLGSAQDVLAFSASQMALDSANVKYQYQLKGLGYQNQANLSQLQGESAMDNAKWGAAAALLQGASSASGSIAGGGGGAT